jgi:cyclohexanone monooxygenase
MMSHGFPNQFFTGSPRPGVSANTTAMFDQQGSHIAHIIKETLARKAVTVEPSRQAQDEWVRIIPGDLGYRPEILAGMHARLLQQRRRRGVPVASGEPYGPGFYAFDRLLQEWRDKGDMEGLVVGT